MGGAPDGTHGAIASIPLTTLDWIIVAFTVLMAVWGYGQGLIAGGLSLVGFAAGAFIGSRLGPLLLEDGSHSPYAPLSALLGAVLIGGLLASGFELLGFHLRSRLGERIGLLDGVGGGLLVACLGLFLVWIGGAVALQTPGARDLREPIQRSAILKELNEVLPPSGPILQALARFDPFPSITGPSRECRAARLRRSRVTPMWRRPAAAWFACSARPAAWACREVAGWRAGGIVVTNAHVVAGQDDTTVQVGGEGAGLDADAIWFDPHNDLSILRVSGLSRRAGAAPERERRPGHGGCCPRLPSERPVHGGAGKARRHGHGPNAGCVRARPGGASDRLCASRGAPGQLRRADGRPLRARDGHDLRDRYQA